MLAICLLFLAVLFGPRWWPTAPATVWVYLFVVGGVVLFVDAWMDRHDWRHGWQKCGKCGSEWKGCPACGRGDKVHRVMKEWGK